MKKVEFSSSGSKSPSNDPGARVESRIFRDAGRVGGRGVPVGTLRSRRSSAAEKSGPQTGQGHWTGSSRGFLLLEPVLAAGLIALVALVVVSTILAGRQGLANVAEHTEALNIAQEGIEAMRSLRDDSYESVPVGVWGLSREGSLWTLEPSPDVTEELYTRSITIAEPEVGVRDVSSRVTWVSNTGEHEVVLKAWITNWR